MKLDNERMSDLLKDPLLSFSVDKLPFRDDELLLEHFHCEDPAAFLLLRKVHFAEGSSSDHFVDDEPVDIQFLDGHQSRNPANPLC